MARSINQIQTSLLKAIADNPTLSTSLTSQSAVSIYNLWTYITAAAMNTEESINDTFLTNGEALITLNPPANPNWVNDKVFKFQYNVGTPQVVQLNTTTFVPEYPNINTAYQIITRCAVVSPYINTNGSVVGTPGVILIKVAKGTNPTALSTTELSALQNYLNIIKPAGIIYKALSVAGDNLYCKMNIWYDGSYAGVIQSNVYNAYIAFIGSLPFNGILKLSDLEVALRSVQGVSDIKFIDVNYRAATVALTSSYNIVNNSTQLLTDTTNLLLAGYVVDETTSGYDFQTINASNYIPV